jgi:hypothetical protein
MLAEIVPVQEMVEEAVLVPQDKAEQLASVEPDYHIQYLVRRLIMQVVVVLRETSEIREVQVGVPGVWAEAEKDKMKNSC